MSKQKDWSKQKFEGQHQGEIVELVFHQHPIVMRKALLIALVVFTVGSLPLAVWPLQSWPVKFLLVCVLLSILIFLYRWISWYYSIFIVTNERIIQIRQNGFFDRLVTDIGHGKVQSVNYEVKGLQATMFHYGTISVQTYVGELALRYIHKPEQVHQLMVKMVREAKPSAGPGVDAGELNAQTS